MATIALDISLDFSPSGVPDMAALEDQEFADPVQGFERQQETPFLDECKFDNFKVATFIAWISRRVCKDKTAMS